MTIEKDRSLTTGQISQLIALDKEYDGANLGGIRSSIQLLITRLEAQLKQHHADTWLRSEQSIHYIACIEKLSQIGLLEGTGRQSYPSHNQLMAMLDSPQDMFFLVDTTKPRDAHDLEHHFKLSIDAQAHYRLEAEFRPVRDLVRVRHCDPGHATTGQRLTFLESLFATHQLLKSDLHGLRASDRLALAVYGDNDRIMCYLLVASKTSKSSTVRTRSSKSTLRSSSIPRSSTATHSDRRGSLFTQRPTSLEAGRFQYKRRAIGSSFSFALSLMPSAPHSSHSPEAIPQSW